jgi:hypothetical protein
MDTDVDIHERPEEGLGGVMQAADDRLCGKAVAVSVEGGKQPPVARARVRNEAIPHVKRAATCI